MPDPMSMMDDDESGDPGPSRPTEGGEEEHQGPTVLVNAELYPDAQPGDVIKVKVVEHHGEELSVQFAGKEGDEEETHGSPVTEEAGPPAESLMD
jgi:hypothetical protein